ncbi:pyrroline-5-carboxylate reductase [Roseospirillum parvum]|uniref:Pyrroline-5-carboxylate reductase n=1 Tax=Roseospirillum parvum TaxID=83401 RepID=A0A1G8A0J6_9PROT|nr:pyrroline-5-carboxylate reductase [Roseospirillum parvum]SDH14423.1 pyrroline-5-carboxylate reductase [Roseospirillum parvum]
MSLESLSLLLVGGGKMGGALLDGWRAMGLDPARARVVEPDPATARALSARGGVAAVPSPEHLPTDFAPEVIILAVKPQMMAKVAPDYGGMARPGTLVVSVAAGIPRASLAGWLGDRAHIVRAMPNTPAAVGRGITVACCPGLEDKSRALVQQLLEAVGEVAWVEDEGLMDAVTAVSGSGPAYVFHLAEALAEAGAKAGLPAEVAARLARVTVAGAGELLHQSPDSPATLRTNVTSPGGTTAAGLEVLMDAERGLARLLEDTVAAAARRSRELAG